MKKTRFLAYSVVIFFIAGCSSSDRAMLSVRSIVLGMQQAKRANNCREYLNYFDHGFAQIIHYPDGVERSKPRLTYAERDIFDWKQGCCGDVRQDDITRYEMSQPAVFSFPAYENIKKFRFERTSNRTIACCYLLRGYGFVEWAEFDVCVTFRKGADREWKVVSLERGIARKSKVEDFN